MIVLGTATNGRIPRYRPAEDSAQPAPTPQAISPNRIRAPQSLWDTVFGPIRWAYRGYVKVNASDMAAAVAFNLLVALVPMLLLLVAISGLFLQSDTVLDQARQAIERVVPGDTSDEAFTAALSARSNTGWIGLLSFVALAWVGTGFVSCLARSMNKIYGARSSGYINEKQRGFFVLIIFSLLFLVSSVASIMPTFFINRDLPEVFDRWILASGRYQVAGYAIGVASALLLFYTLYRVVPNAGQRARDVMPGTVASATLFMGVTQIFPIYIRLIGGGNRYGQILGFVSLMVASLLILAHIILFGAYVNASWQRNRRMRRRRMLELSGGATHFEVTEAMDDPSEGDQ